MWLSPTYCISDLNSDMVAGIVGLAIESDAGGSEEVAVGGEDEVVVVLEHCIRDLCGDHCEVYIVCPVVATVLLSNV